MIENLEGEIWKDIPEWEGIYQVSHLGRVRSLDRVRRNGTSSRVYYGIVLKGYKDKDGYIIYRLSEIGSKDGKYRKGHQLVAECFHNYKRGNKYLVVNHKDNNPQNNHMDNLEITTVRYNSVCHKKKYQEGYIGSYLEKSTGKHISSINLLSKKYYLGRFDFRDDAIKAYKNALNKFEEFNILPYERK